MAVLFVCGMCGLNSAIYVRSIAWDSFTSTLHQHYSTHIYMTLYTINSSIHLSISLYLGHHYIIHLLFSYFIYILSCTWCDFFHWLNEAIVIKIIWWCLKDTYMFLIKVVSIVYDNTQYILNNKNHKRKRKKKKINKINK